MKFRNCISSYCLLVGLIVWIQGRNGYSELMPTRSERQAMIAAKMPSSPVNVELALTTPQR